MPTGTEIISLQEALLYRCVDYVDISNFPLLLISSVLCPTQPSASLCGSSSQPVFPVELCLAPRVTEFIWGSAQVLQELGTGLILTGGLR